MMGEVVAHLNIFFHDVITYYTLNSSFDILFEAPCPFILAMF